MASTTKDQRVEAASASRKAAALASRAPKEPRGTPPEARASGARAMRTGTKQASERDTTKALHRAHAELARFHEAGLRAKVRLTDLVPAD
jgi:hypothetical protein